ncbi:DNA-binding MarR family transcriptional regulator [Orbus hercynius]|uniref:DNA-binding MarR family transcriptional regulator n=1 Tax=Orbus hercynius TaxID=593135 RepID=A0A495RD51_9GAMM|nr:MarR family transcriptional regulator [Orbus hercynius]RKS85281.1 DNA-binding MarR family transcriptional regulator [Orbus hercynius]
MTTHFSGKLYHQLHYCTNLLQRGHGAKKNQRQPDMHRGQGRTLSLVNQNNGISQRALAELLHIRPPSLGELLTKLEANQLIERRPHDTDRRISNVFITEAGRASVAEVEALRQSYVDALFAGLSSEEQQTLSGLLDKLLDTLKSNLGELDDDESHDDDHGHRRRHHHYEKHGRGERRARHRDERQKSDV